MNQQVLYILVLIGLTTAQETLYPRGCIYALGRCIQECEVGTHAYTTGCSQRIPEPTCEIPTPTAEPGILCDYSACYCDSPTVRRKDGKCVNIQDCNLGGTEEGNQGKGSGNRGARSYASAQAYSSARAN